VAYAQTNVDAPGTFSGSFIIYALDETWVPAWVPADELYGSVSGTIAGPGGTVGIRVERHAVNPYDPPHTFPDYEVRIYGTANAGTLPPPESYRVAGTWKWTGGMPPPQSNVQWEYSGDTDTSEACEGSCETLHLYKQRIAVDPLPGELSYVCHPLQLEMHYAWGNVDGYTDACGSSIETDSVSSKTMTPSDGTRSLPSLVIGLGIQPTLSGVSGVVAKWEDLTYLGYSVDLSGYSYEGNGVTAEGSGDTLTLTVVDATEIPSGGAGVSLTIYAPVIVDFDLRGFDWDREYSGSGSYYSGDTGYAGAGMMFQVPRNYPDPLSGDMYDEVNSPFVERRIYWAYSWDTTYERLWEVAPTMLAAWATANDENPSPSDLPCTIEERGLDHTLSEGEDWADWQWEGFQVGRSASLNVQKPSDATSLPSAWTTSTPGMAVSQDGEITTVDISSSVENGSISRTFKTAPTAGSDADYYEWLVGDGLDTYGLPAVYRYLLHLQTCDIWNWCQYPILAIGYDSDKAVTLTLRVLYSDLTIIDTRVTGSTRTEDYIAGGVQRTSGQVLEYDVEFGAGAGTVYVDLAWAQDIKLQHVDGIEFTGFDGDGDWQWKLTSLKLVATTPDGTGSGKTTATVTFPRPSGGLPICYIAFRTTADGQRCCNPPDEAVTLCDEEGLDFCDRLTGVSSGVILDRMVELSSWFITLARQEGMLVDTVTDPTSDDYSGFACDPSHATYQAAFWDADENDMLSGTLYTGDVCETFDLEVASDGTETVVPVKPRVGCVYLAAGVPIPCVVRKHVRGNTHGCVRDGTGRVADISVYSFERNPANGTIVALQTDTTDAWGRWSRKGLGGGREQWRIAATTTDSSAGITSWLKVYNELRQWVGSFDESLWYPNLDIDGGGVAWIAATDGDTIVHVGYLDPKATETVWVEKPFGGARGYAWPSIACLDDGGVLVAATHNEGTVLARSRDRGATWSTITMGIGSGYQYGDICYRHGITYVCGWQNDAIRFQASGAEALTGEDLIVGTDELTVCTAVVNSGDEIPRSSIVTADDRGVVVAVSQDGVLTYYRCRSYGSGFVEVTSA